MDLWTIKDISRELDVPESNLRYYRDRFEDFLPSVGQGRKRRYKNEALEVFRYIVQGFQNDKSTEQIAEELPKHFPRKLDFDEQEPVSTHSLLPRLEDSGSSNSIFHLLQSQARTLERFSHFLFRRGEPVEITESLRSDQQKLKRGVILLHRDLKKIKSAQDVALSLPERCAALEDRTETLQHELAEIRKQLEALEAKSREDHEELRRTLQDCLHLMRRMMETDIV